MTTPALPQWIKTNYRGYQTAKINGRDVYRRRKDDAYQYQTKILDPSLREKVEEALSDPPADIPSTQGIGMVDLSYHIVRSPNRVAGTYLSLTLLLTLLARVSNTWAVTMADYVAGNMSEDKLWRLIFRQKAPEQKHPVGSLAEYLCGKVTGVVGVTTDYGEISFMSEKYMVFHLDYETSAEILGRVLLCTRTPQFAHLNPIVYLDYVPDDTFSNVCVEHSIQLCYPEMGGMVKLVSILRAAQFCSSGPEQKAPVQGKAALVIYRYPSGNWEYMANRCSMDSLSLSLSLMTKSHPGIQIVRSYHYLPGEAAEYWRSFTKHNGLITYQGNQFNLNCTEEEQVMSLLDDHVDILRTSH